MKKLLCAVLTLLITIGILTSCAKMLPQIFGEKDTPSPEQTTASGKNKTETQETPEPKIHETKETPGITDTTPEVTADTALNYVPNIIDSVYSDSIDVGGGRVLVATGFYPQTGVQEIDSYYEAERELFITDTEDWADEFRAYEDEPEWLTQYDISEDYEVIKNSGNILSVHRTYYIYAGGAHGSHSDICDSFRISDGKKLTLDDIFDCSYDVYKTALCAVFDAYIDADFASTDDGYGQIGFFEDAKESLREYFPAEDFCITDSGIDFFMAPYYIGPYAAGTIVLPVTWEDLWSLPLKDFT